MVLTLGMGSGTSCAWTLETAIKPVARANLHFKDNPSRRCALWRNKGNSTLVLIPVATAISLRTPQSPVAPFGPTQKLRVGTAAYPSGQAAVWRILEGARRLFIKEGHKGMTMRCVAKAAGISPGNLSYYYRTRSDSLEDLLEDGIGGYIEQFDRLRNEVHDDPDAQFRQVIGYVYDDLASRSTTLFFPELWVLANRDAWTAQQMEKMYAKYPAVLTDVISLINPKPNQTRKSDWALKISASVEGHTLFIGHWRPHRAGGGRLKDLLIEHFLRLIKESDEAIAQGQHA